MKNNLGQFTGTKCVDHKGNCFESFTEMAEYYGINKDVFFARIRSGWSLKKALTTPVIPRKICCTDHLGNKYNSKKEMCMFYNIDMSTFNTRLKYGYSLEQALTTPLNQNKHTVSKGSIMYHGRVYGSLNEMCSEFKICSSTFKTRLKNIYNATDDEITAAIAYCKGERFIAPDGTKWKNQKDYFKAIGLNAHRIYDDVYKGASLEDAIKKQQSSSFVTDHKGNIYTTIKEMCKTYNIHRQTYERRRNNGWSLEKALTTPVGVNKKGFTRKGDIIKKRRHYNVNPITEDHNGIKYKSQKAMCEAWNIPVHTFIERTRIHGWDLQKALETPQKGKIDVKIGDSKIMSCGLKFTITDIIKGKQRRVRGIFEDQTVGEGYLHAFQNKTLQHRSLRPNPNYKNVEYCGFQVQYIGQSDNGQVWYKAQNMKTGEKCILTPQEIIKNHI